MNNTQLIYSKIYRLLTVFVHLIQSKYLSSLSKLYLSLKEVFYSVFQANKVQVIGCLYSNLYELALIAVTVPHALFKRCNLLLSRSGKAISRNIVSQSIQAILLEKLGGCICC